MRPLYGQSLVYCSQSVLTSAGPAQDRSQLDLPTPNAATLPFNTPTALTGKERLSKKWMDEQRIDNCNVPIDKRGNKPQPSTRA
jgi:hypothetical protein